MKKLALVLILVLFFALPVLANPFVDVPLDHWAYDAVQSLSAKGIIVGYPDGTFGGEEPLTRYKFAEAVVKALAYVEIMDFASAEDVAILEKLAIEFADELASLGVTVADLEAALGTNTEAIAALEATVDKLDTFFEPLTVTGEFRVRYNKVVSPEAPATLEDRTRLNFKATINDQTTAGIRLQVEDIIPGETDITWSKFFIDHQGDNLQLRIGEVEPDTIGLGLIFDSDDFDGFLAVWAWDEEDDLGDWTLFGEAGGFYVGNVAFPLGDEDEVAVGVTGSYDVSASGYAGSLDLGFSLGDANETAVAVEGAAFYDTALSYAVAASVETALEDLDLAVDAYYVLPEFAPTNSGFTADRLGSKVKASYPLTDDVAGTLYLNYEMDSDMVDTTKHDIKGKLVYTIDADTDEEATVWAKYYVLTKDTKAWVDYLNYPLADDYSLSGAVVYDYPAATYAGVATLVYDFAEDTELTVEGRVDSDGAAFWSTEIELAYNLAEKTTLSVGFEMNDWEDGIFDYDDLTINDTLGTLKAELKVSF